MILKINPMRRTVGTGDDLDDDDDWKAERTGGEILTLQFGTFSNTIGAHYWNLQVRPKSMRGMIEMAAIAERLEVL